MTKLVFIHGRAQEGKDSVALKAEWFDAWRAGLARAGRSTSMADADVRFPYYGQTLADLVAGMTPEQAAAVVVRGPAAGGDAEEQRFVNEVLLEAQRRAGIDDAEVAAASGQPVVQRGPLNWGWVQSLLQVLDRHVPLASGASIALATRDVYQYLTNPAVRDEIDTGVRQAMTAGEPTIVVAHSLGTVVAYHLLRREGAQRGWNVPVLITLGSPLGVTAIRKRLAPNRRPECVGRWLNAMDERDVVALYPLDAANFPVEPLIVNKTDVDNPTRNRHGISGYLGDPTVAAWIDDALRSL